MCKYLLPPPMHERSRHSKRIREDETGFNFNSLEPDPKTEWVVRLVWGWASKIYACYLCESTAQFSNQVTSSTLCVGPGLCWSWTCQARRGFAASCCCPLLLPCCPPAARPAQHAGLDRTTWQRRVHTEPKNIDNKIQQ